VHKVFKLGNSVVVPKNSVYGSTAISGVRLLTLAIELFK
jgi:hypothetical protein